MACEEGQEDHLTRLAGDVDARIAELRSSFGEIGGQRLTVMAAIMAADELSEARRRIVRLEGELQQAKAARQAALRHTDEGEGRFAAHLSEAADAIERLARKLGQPK